MHGPDNEYAAWARTRGMSLVDVLEEFPSVSLSLGQLLTSVPELRPRTYSVSSDPDSAAGTVDLTFMLHSGNGYKGVCTGYLSGLQPGQTVAVKAEKSDLVPPKDEELLVAVALGTGISPVRALLHRRLALKERGGKPGHVLLYYGFRSKATDYLYADEFLKFGQAGLVEVHPACSHEVPGKYETPLDLIDGKPRVLHDMLRSGASFFYCGLGGAIPKMVESTVQRALHACRETAISVRKLREQGKYLEEFFSTDVDAENLFQTLYGNKEAPIASKYQGAEMFCFQCEQTYHGTGCVKVGVCGKQPSTAWIQDLLVHLVKIWGWYNHHGQKLGVPENRAADRQLLFCLFATMTNVNFDDARLAHYCKDAYQRMTTARAAYEAACAAKGVPVQRPALLPPKESVLLQGLEADLVQEGKMVGVLEQFQQNPDEAAESLAQLLMYGMKGMAAYADHARGRNKEDAAVYQFFNEACALLASPERTDMGKMLDACMRCGSTNVRVMQLLYECNSSFGTPQPTEVPATPTPGKCILVSGHDLVMLDSLLRATAKTGIKVYTHGEMLPCHAYPALKAYGNLYGHFGGPWNRQSVEFPHFPGSIVMTTNCITQPQPSYADRLFTMGPVGWTGLAHLGDEYQDYDWSAVIAKALAMPGFTGADKKFSYPAQDGQISRFFVVGGCDGYEGFRSYYTDLTRVVPETSVMLTMGCGKYRVNCVDKGTIGSTGIPRVLDCGQCNDSYSAVQVALGLASALKCEVKDLPLSIVLSWLEQKAVAVLLSLLSLGIKPIHYGPHIPAFFNKDVIAYLEKNCGLIHVGDAVQDAKKMCSAKGMA
eukprot:RCo052723